MTFKEYLKGLDTQMFDTLGCGHDDVPDMDWHNYWKDEADYSDIINDILEDNGFAPI